MPWRAAGGLPRQPGDGHFRGGALRYDDTLPPILRRHQPSQEEFYILSRSFVE